MGAPRVPSRRRHSTRENGRLGQEPSSLHCDILRAASLFPPQGTKEPPGPREGPIRESPWGLSLRCDFQDVR